MEHTIKYTGSANQTKAKRMGALVVAYGHIVACLYTWRGPRAAARILLHALRSWRVGALCEQDAAPASHKGLRRGGVGVYSPLLAVLVVHVRQRAHLPGAGNAHAPPGFR